LTNKEKNQVVYRLAYNYLLDILPNQLDSDDLHKYFIGDRRDFSSLADVFEQLIQSAQNYQRMPNVIKFTERKEKIKTILCEYDFTEMLHTTSKICIGYLEKNSMLPVRIAIAIVGINGVSQ